MPKMSVTANKSPIDLQSFLFDLRYANISFWRRCSFGVEVDKRVIRQRDLTS